MRLRADKNFWRLWLAIVGTATIVLLGAYTMVQQQNRLSAYDSPLALNQSVVYALDAGSIPSQAVPANQSKLRDLIPFAIITDANQQVQASSQAADSVMILPPKGTFENAKAHGQNRFTWQPSAHVRLATIITAYKNGDKYIITGQSLREAESRIAIITALMLFTGLAVIIWATLALAWQRR